ncbi:hypothetical protein SBI67_14920 [Mycolicibacterium sp. 120266]|uniref:hypothetical protein n=1 Tax=Mycolicibacterium sp. 120266 TaxID=3090601 RepID=UPI00299DA45C|nr:hypothetical protein [Mycolicibacterium sp. 120266]MDX1873412.1 hypothetical protein [Mycolicibacterium sp. 120266]
MADPTRRGRRGPTPDPDPRSPSGYRISDRRRFELAMAQPFVGKFTLQDVIDVAVTEFLERQYNVEGFRAALHNAENNQRARRRVPTIGSDQADVPTHDDGPEAG